jgi:hypothetical protein
MRTAGRRRGTEFRKCILVVREQQTKCFARNWFIRHQTPLHCTGGVSFECLICTYEMTEMCTWSLVLVKAEHSVWKRGWVCSWIGVFISYQTQSSIQLGNSVRRAGALWYPKVRFCSHDSQSLNSRTSNMNPPHQKLKLCGLSPRANYTDRANSRLSAKLVDRVVSRGQCQGSPRPYSRLSRPEPLLYLPSSSSIVLMRLSGHRLRATTSQKIW